MLNSPITVSDSARTRLTEAMMGNGAPFVRFYVTSKGCSGHGYGMGLAASAEDDDYQIDLGGGLAMIIDPESMTLLAGTTVNWAEDQLGGGFEFDNPNASGACGCGSSFKTGSSYDDDDHGYGGCGS